MMGFLIKSSPLSNLSRKIWFVRGRLVFVSIFDIILSMDKDLAIKESVKIIRKYLPVGYKVILFGSWARGNALDASDIDIGVMGEKEIPRELMRKILEEIGALPTLRSIDILDLMSTEENYKNKILEYAKPLA